MNSFTLSHIKNPCAKPEEMNRDFGGYHLDK